MIKENLQIISNNLSLAWAETFLASLEPGVEEISPMSITVRDLIDDVPEMMEVRNALDQTLVNCGKFKTHTTANTIFPISLWNPEKNREDLFLRYHKILPGLKRADHHNRYGVYFERLVDYGIERQNQLDFIIKSYKGGNHRRSALQAAVYNPLSDQRNQPLRGFPCLQQVAFVPYPHLGQLAIHGFYATQYLFERAYGNLLGLARLGTFMAHEMGLQLSRITCTASVAKYGNTTRRDLSLLAASIREILERVSSN